MIMQRTMIILLSISLVVMVLAFVAIITTWAIKCILEWIIDIEYWWKDLKERHKHE